MRRFCTKYSDPPRYYAGPDPEFNHALFDKVRKKVEIVLTDAASNELLASNVTRGARDPNIEEPGAEVLVPNLSWLQEIMLMRFAESFSGPSKPLTICLL